MDFLHFDNDDYEIDESFEKKYPWDPDMPKGWQYREGTNRNGNPYRGYFPSPFDEDASPILLQAYWPYGDPEELARQRERRENWSNDSWSSGDPSTGDYLEAMYWGVPNML